MQNCKTCFAKDGSKICALFSCWYPLTKKCNREWSSWTSSEPESGRGNCSNRLQRLVKANKKVWNSCVVASQLSIHYCIFLNEWPCSNKRLYSNWRLRKLENLFYTSLLNKRLFSNKRPPPKQVLYKENLFKDILMDEDYIWTKHVLSDCDIVCYCRKVH